MPRSEQKASDEEFGAIGGWEDELFDRPGHLIRRCYQITMALHALQAQDIGVTQLQYVLLRSIQHHPGLSQRRLGEVAGLDRTTVGWVVTTLEGRGLLCRRDDPSDRRHRPLELTPSGLQKLAEMEPRVHAIQKQLLEPLDEREKSAFIASLQKIVTTYNQHSRAPLRGNESSEVEAAKSKWK